MTDNLVSTPSPSWMITFVRFQNRSPKTLPIGVGEADDARKPLVVINDCISVSTGNSKASPNGSCQLTLKMGDINYLTAIAPGDYIVINIALSDGKILELYNRALSGKSINRPGDGFRGMFRVQSIHKTLSIDPSGKPSATIQVTGYAFSEMNDVIYFNPYLVTEGEKNNDIFFLTQMSDSWNKIIGLKKGKDDFFQSVQNLMILLMQTFLGSGIDNEGKKLKDGMVRTENNLYLLPKGLGPLMGLSKAKYAADLVNMVCGIQKYKKSKEYKAAFNPIIKNELKGQSGRVYITDIPVQGVSYAKPEYWNQVRVWDILGSYLNSTVNEMYTGFKPDPRTGNIMPTLVIRQKPFTTERFSKDNPSEPLTRFRNLPRWKIDPEDVVSIHVGRDDAARINFVQVFGRSQAIEGESAQGASTAMQIAMHNYDIDREDIKRNGLRPLITSSNFDHAGTDLKSRSSRAPFWAQLVGDWVIGGHLKMSGTIVMKGTILPMEAGDNLEFDDTIYHIEGVQHQTSIGGKGERIYRTTLQLSSGVATEKDARYAEYAEMNHTDADEYRKSKDSSKSINPGVSDSQDLPNASNRSNAEKTAPNKEFPFDQPSSNPDKTPAAKNSNTQASVLDKEEFEKTHV
jgi:hypothetical protein